MASKVYDETDIVLQDDTEVSLRPLPIGRLRRFMEAWGKFAELDEGDDGFDIFINCCGISIEDSFGDKFTTTKPTAAQKAKGEYLSSEYKEYLLDVLDLETIYKILEVTGGIKLNDPKLQEELQAAARESAGTN